MLINEVNINIYLYIILFINDTYTQESIMNACYKTAYCS